MGTSQHMPVDRHRREAVKRTGKIATARAALVNGGAGSASAPQKLRPAPPLKPRGLGQTGADRPEQAQTVLTRPDQQIRPHRALSPVKNVTPSAFGRGPALSTVDKA